MNGKLRVSHGYWISFAVGLVSVAVGSAVQAQTLWNDCCPSPGPQDVTTVHRTYGGRIYLSFPNYDIFLGGAPTTLGDLATGAGVADARVIYRNDRGMRWDGDNFFVHPAYPVDQITRHRTMNRLVGEGNGTWPPAQVPVTTTYYSTARPATYAPAGWPAKPSSAVGGTELNHRPMPNTVPFTGNAWVVEPSAVPDTRPTDSGSPGLAPPVTPTTGHQP